MLSSYVFGENSAIRQSGLSEKLKEKDDMSVLYCYRFSDLRITIYKVYVVGLCPPKARISLGDVQAAIKKLKSKRTTGLDFLPQYLFKGCSGLLAEPLTYLYNLCIVSNSFPEKWKTTKVVKYGKMVNTNTKKWKGVTNN